MPLNPSYSPPSGAYAGTATSYDPETIAMMKQMGIWHPALVNSPNSRRGVEDSVAMTHIQEMRAHQKALDESRAARTQGHEESLAQRGATASMVEQGRNDRAAQIETLRHTAEQDRVTQGLLAGANAAGFGTPEHKALMGEYMKRLGVSPEAVAAAVPKPQGEFGGKTTAAPTVPVATNPYGGAPRISAGVSDLAHAPAGYDLNANTGEYVRKDQPQFINGREIGGTATTPAAAAAKLPNPAPKPETAPLVDTFSKPEGYQPPTAAFTTTPVSGRGEFAGAYPLQPNTGNNLLDFPSTPPPYIAESERQRILAQQKLQQPLVLANNP